MKIFLAGLYGRPFVVEDHMKIYLAGMKYKWLFKDEDQDMNIYLAGQRPWETDGIYDKLLNDRICILDSFYYVTEWSHKFIKNKTWDFMLDSGAFTFMEKGKGEANWESYIDRYCEFINEFKVDKFFELDIDSISNLKTVEKFRKRIESKTGKQTIPVWHRSRGKDYFIQMCKDYDYVSIGGIVSGEWKGTNPDVFKWFVNTAHEHGAKIHALGYTNLKGIKKYKFDSVDSTAWTTGNRFGHLYLFKNGTMHKVNRTSKQKMGDGKKLAIHNFNAWIQFQKYAKKYM